MTAVIYARYSSDNQREESIEGQIRECTAYAKKNGITIVKHYIDRAISAKTDNRPEFQQMIKDSDKKLFDIVLVWKLDRFARNRYDSARYKTQLKKNGVKLMSATEIISEGPEGIILESVLEGYAEYYSADLAEKVVRGQTENILKGRCNGGRGTFGYTLDSERKFHIDPLASPFVLESFRKYRDGLTMKEIRDWLNENGIKNPVGGAFTYNSVEHMLKNRRYIGELKFRDVVVPDAIPPIVPLELFDDVQEKMLKNKKAPARRKAEDDYLLTTKLHCGYCGALMFGESGTSRTGEVHRYYKCATAKKKKGCKKKTVRKAAAMERFIFCQQLRSSGTMNAAVHPAPAEQRVVCGIHYCVNSHFGYIIFNNLQRHGKLLFGYKHYALLYGNLQGKRCDCKPVYKIRNFYGTVPAAIFNHLRCSKRYVLPHTVFPGGRHHHRRWYLPCHSAVPSQGGGT